MSEHEPEHTEQEEQVSQVSDVDPQEAGGRVSPDDVDAEDPAEDS